MLKKIVNWLIPVTCVVCRKQTSNAFCEYCLAELPWISNGCIRCANEIVTDYANKECGDCLIDPPLTDRNVTLFYYTFPVDSLITQLKFRKKLSYAYSLGHLLTKEVLKQYHLDNRELPECLLPVPLHKSRLAIRGYNQAVEIARPLKKCLKIPIELRAVKRTKATLAQTLITIEERPKNMQGAFSLVREFNYNHIAIIDDVITSFSTITSLAKTFTPVWCGKDRCMVHC